MEELNGYAVATPDGKIGNVHDFLFDDEIWAVRYIVVDTGNWLSGRKILLIPSIAGQPDWKTSTLPVRISRKQIRESPEIDVDKPISRQAEVKLYKHFNWTPYWVEPKPGFVSPVLPESEKAGGDSGNKSSHPRLQSNNNVIGYKIRATDGPIGLLDQFIVDDSNWFIRYLVVDIRARLIFWKKVLISPEWIERMNRHEPRIFVDLPKKLIKQSPNYDPEAPVNRQLEERLYDYYGRPKYWG